MSNSAVDCPVQKRLKALGIELATSAPALANYLPYQLSDTRVYISGQGPVHGDHEITGKLGHDLSIELGNQAAHMAAINIICQLGAALDNEFSRVRKCLKLGGFVNASEDFIDHPRVINGASDLIVDVFGERGRHARVAVGVASLPRNWSVEIDAIFELDPPAE